MKKNAFFPAVMAGLSLIASAAHATDGTIDFQGRLVAQTCTIDVDGQKAFLATVSLPKVPTGLLTTAGQTAGPTRFTIGLSNCRGTATSAAAFFENGPTVDLVSGNLGFVPGPGRATNVQLQLVDASNGRPIRAGDIRQLTSTTRLPIDASGNATLPYAVQYYATGAATAGQVLSSVLYSINYQ